MMAQFVNTSFYNIRPKIDMSENMLGSVGRNVYLVLSSFWFKRLFLCII